MISDASPEQLLVLDPNPENDWVLEPTAENQLVSNPISKKKLVSSKVVNREANYQETNGTDCVGICEDSKVNCQETKTTAYIRIYEASYR